MSKRMLIDGAHPEEIRVVVTSGNKLDEYDIETSFKKQFKGNIYLAKVTRVEPSLQAAFVDFGGNRHGFLAFSEIHPDYYQIPVEDRQRLLEEQQEAFEMNARAAQEHLDDIDGGIADEDADGDEGEEAAADDESAADAEASDDEADTADAASEEAEEDADESGVDEADTEDEADTDGEAIEEPDADAAEELSASEDADSEAETGDDPSDEGDADEEGSDDAKQADAKPAKRGRGKRGAAEKSRSRRVRGSRRYKIQEVIKRRQILLVQVVKEERGNKGAALTTYISLAGRYCVLMPNSSRGGGISRKITSAKERRKLRDTLNALDMPQGMGVIIRTAGLERSKAEIRRDFEYLIRAWDEVREVTLESTAPCLVYEEGNIIKRAIRDVYSKDIDEIQIEGTETYQTAKKFMRLMMPSHAKRVQPYRDETIPLFQRFQIEQQLDAMHHPEVQLKSGGYIVINPTEALVAIDVNSGRSTRERNIEETAVKTNIEAADEVARQLRLRDLAGLIVIDFIDMEDGRNVRKVERRMREAMKNDRARLQIGRISNFGLMELSRQRLRPSLIETSTQICPHCRGTGYILSTESMAMRVLRAIEEEGIRMRTSEITVRVPTEVALYILNHKRSTLVDMEGRYGFQVLLEADDTVVPPDIEMERVKGKPEPSQPGKSAEAPDADDTETGKSAKDGDEAEEPKRSRRRRGRRRKRDDDAQVSADAETDAAEETTDETTEAAADAAASETGDEESATPRRRRRGRRGGRRRNRKAAGDGEATQTETGEDADTASAESAANGADKSAETADADESDAPAAEDSARPEADVADTGAAPDDEGDVGEPAEAAANDDAAPVEEVSEPDVAGPAPVDEVEAEAESAASDAEPDMANEEADEEADEPDMIAPAVSDRPKRRGWWQRVVE